MPQTKAEAFLLMWRERLEPCDDPAAWAREVDPLVRIEGFLYTNRKKFIFSDRSKAILSNDRVYLP